MVSARGINPNNLVKYSSVRNGLRYVCPDGAINFLKGDDVRVYRQITRKRPKLNPKKLGYICPDGVINFQTQDVAKTYAKNRVISALKEKDPFERAVFMKNNSILREIDGDDYSVDCSFMKGDVDNAVLVHGHPDVGKGTMPLSLNDYINFLNLNLSEMTAYNVRGEYSTISKNMKHNGEFKSLPNPIKVAVVFLRNMREKIITTNRFGKTYKTIFPRKYQEKFEMHFHEGIGIKDGGNFFKIRKAKQNPITDAEGEKLSYIENKHLRNGSLAQLIHNFWRTTAPKLGLKYETNFSNLAN